MDLLQSQVTPLLEMDTAQLSKIEKGLQQLKREQVPIFADILKDSQICAIVKDEKLANVVMLVDEKEMISNGRKKVK
jgi:RNA:NAD 2'-phosphotransferase (TPT1/KptA family)